MDLGHINLDRLIEDLKDLQPWLSDKYTYDDQFAPRSDYQIAEEMINILQGIPKCHS